MGDYNVVSTVLHSTRVDCSAVGKFTGDGDVNLILGKGNKLEIYHLRDENLSKMLELQVYGRIKFLQLFRPHGDSETRDKLFVMTHNCQYFLLRWDDVTCGVITRAKGQCTKSYAHHAKERVQTCTVDPDGKLIALYMFYNILFLLPFENGQLKRPFRMILDRDVAAVEDIKFLFECEEPTIAVLCQIKSDKDATMCSKLITYKFIKKNDSYINGPWCIWLIKKAKVLIPVPQPLGGVLIIGRESIHFHSDSKSKIVNFTNATTKIYTRLEGDNLRYLVGDKAGQLHLIHITQKNGKFSELSVTFMGETSFPSTMSSLGRELVFFGSAFGDSHLLKLNPLPGQNGSCIEALERYANIAPITDLCLVEESDREGRMTIVTCSGFGNEGSLRILRYGFDFDKLASLKLEGITGMWSLRSSTADVFEKYLVASFIRETLVFELTSEDVLEDTDIEGFSSDERTLFSGNVAHNQLIQVTSSSVRLVNSTSRKLVCKWNASGFSIDVCTANLKQVLLAGDGNLVYIQIENGVLDALIPERKYSVSCLDINPIGKERDSSNLAAVGLWSDFSVNIFSLPRLELLMKTRERDTISRSVLLCELEGIAYLLCARGDGCLLKFLLDRESGQLTDRIEVSLECQPMSLRILSSKDTTLVFAASDKPSVIYSWNNKLLDSSLDLKEVTHVCPFSSASFPDSLAIVEDGELKIGTFNFPKLIMHSIPLQEYALKICHQHSTETYALACAKPTKPSKECVGSIRLLNDKTFRFITRFPLQRYEYSASVISCSFSRDNNVYYCVGTGYFDENRNAIDKGRILVLLVEDGQLKLVAEKETNFVGSLNAFRGKLLASTHNTIKLYMWKVNRNGTRELQLECEHSGNLDCPLLETRGNTIVSGGDEVALFVLDYKRAKGTIEVAGLHCLNWSTAIKILNDNLFLGCDSECNLFTVRKNIKGAGKQEGEGLDMAGKFHLDDSVNMFQHGSLLIGMPGSCVGQFPSCMYGTMSGGLGVVASISHDDYLFLQKLQYILSKLITSVGELDYKKWRSCLFSEELNRENDVSDVIVRIEDAENFLDGDLIGRFLELGPGDMDQVSSAMAVPVEVLIQKVKELARLR